MATTREDLMRLVEGLPDAFQEQARVALEKVTTMPERHDLDELAREQGVGVVKNFEDLLGDFWPEDESVDDFLDAVREWRREGTTESSA